MKIWELSDLDQDGQLDRDEFLIVRKRIPHQIKFCRQKVEKLFILKALKLLNKAKEGTPVPDQLPPSLLPVKVRHSSLPNASTGYIMGKGSVVSLPLNLSIVNDTKVIKINKIEIFISYLITTNLHLAMDSNS